MNDTTWEISSIVIFGISVGAGSMLVTMIWIVKDVSPLKLSEKRERDAKSKIADLESTCGCIRTIAIQKEQEAIKFEQFNVELDEERKTLSAELHSAKAGNMRLHDEIEAVKADYAKSRSATESRIQFLETYIRKAKIESIKAWGGYQYELCDNCGYPVDFESLVECSVHDAKEMDEMKLNKIGDNSYETPLGGSDSDGIAAVVKIAKRNGLLCWYTHNDHKVIVQPTDEESDVYRRLWQP